jgi:uncharacterized Zn finger protein
MPFHPSPSIAGLTVDTIRSASSTESFARGQEYVAAGRVLSVEESGPGRLRALVKGTQFTPYTVRIQHGAAGVERVECGCPFATGSWCKHIVAVLLTRLAEESAEPNLVELVSDLPREVLERMVLQAAYRSGVVEENLREAARKARG